jgi:hypothetical protein
VRIGEAQGNLERALSSRADQPQDEDVPPPGGQVPADPAVKRARVRFFAAVDAFKIAAGQAARQPSADPAAVYAAFTGHVADLYASLHREHKRPVYAGDDPRADLHQALSDLRRVAARASRRHGASPAAVYDTVAEQLPRAAAGDQARPAPVPAGNSGGPEQPDASQPVGPAVQQEDQQPPREPGAPDPGPARGPRAIRRGGRGDGPDFQVRLRLTGACGSPHDFRAGAPVILIYGPGEAAPEDRAAYEDLLRGSYRRDGNYPCSEGCDGRHPAMSVSRLDFPPWRETLLYVAPSARKSWTLPDEKLIGVTRDMSPEAISRVLAARPPR